MNVFAWVSTMILGAVVFYQIFGLDEAMAPMAADHVDFDIKKSETDPNEPKDHH